MTDGAEETLATALAGRTEDQVAAVLVRRPDLAAGLPPRSIEALAERALTDSSIAHAFHGLTLPEQRLLQVIVCSADGLPLGDLLERLPAGSRVADIEPLLASLEIAALIWRTDGRIHHPPAVAQLVPVPVGPPLRELAELHTVDYLRHAVSLIRRDARRARGVSLPPPVTRPGGKPLRKAELLTELRSLLGTPGVVAALVAGAPADAAAMARRQIEHAHPVRAHSLWFSPYGQSFATTTPTYWLFERALLLPLPGTDHAAQPREVTVALRDGKVVEDLALTRPPLVAGRTDPGTADAAGAARAQATIDLLADLLGRWRAEPVRELKSGGLGARALKPIAAALEVDPVEASRLIELAHLAGLLHHTRTSHVERRKVVHESHVTASEAAAAWLDRPAPVRWRQLAAAWLRAGHWPSAAGTEDEGSGKPIPLLVRHHADGAPLLRRLTLTALADLDGEPGPTGAPEASGSPATSPERLATRLYWQRPGPWLASSVGSTEPAVAWIWAEAELLGLVADGRLTSLGRAVLAGDHDGAEAAFVAAAPAAATRFTLQADLTAVVVGALDRDVLTELRLLADVESQGAATTYRFSSASVRRALDAGRHGDGIVAFLTEHATKGVPGPLAFLVADTARRHGHLQVGTARTYVVADDVAVLADACSHRRTRKLGLRLLAPTVAVSAADPVKVLDGLRDAGFLPVALDDDGGVALRPAPLPATGGEHAGDATGPPAQGHGGELPEPLAERRHGRADPPPPLATDDARALAARILSGAPDDPKAAAPPRRRAPVPDPPSLFPVDEIEIELAPPSADGTLPLVAALQELDLVPWGTWEDGDPGEKLDVLIDGAITGGHVLIIAAAGRRTVEPLVMMATDHSDGELVGLDPVIGDTLTVERDLIVAVVDLGPIDGLADLIGSPPPRPRRRRR